MIVFFFNFNLKLSGLTDSHLPYHFHLPCSWVLGCLYYELWSPLCLKLWTSGEEMVNSTGKKESELYFLDWNEVTQWVKYPPAMQETPATWVWSLGQKDPLEEEMATHSTLFPRRIPWTEEPDKLQSTGLQRVGHERSYRACPRTSGSCTLASSRWEFCCCEAGNW